MKISEKAWNAFTKAKFMLRGCSMEEMRMAMSKHVLPCMGIQKDNNIPERAYKDTLDWQTMNTMEGLIELINAVQQLKQAGIIEVEKPWTGENSIPDSATGAELPDDLEDIHDQEHGERKGEMEISEKGLHGLGAMVRRIRRLSIKDKAKLYHILKPNPVSDLIKAEYDALTEDERAAYDAARVDFWHSGMEEALQVLEHVKIAGLRRGSGQQGRTERA